MVYHPCSIWCPIRGSLILATLLMPCHAISISVYLAPPNAVASPATGGTAYNENFNNWSLGNRTSPVNRPIGTFQLSSSSALNIRGADVYGGANGTRYAAFGAQSGTSGAISLNLSNPAEYFGLWWSAVDANNGVSFYNGNDFLFHFSGADVIALLAASPTLVAQDGTTTYTASQYRSRSANPGEYYAYTMFRISGLTFTKVVFDNSGSIATGFELDNLQIRTGNLSIPATSVLLRTYNVTPVPEPAVWIPAGAALVWLAHRRRTDRGLADTSDPSDRKQPSGE